MHGDMPFLFLNLLLRGRLAWGAIVFFGFCRGCSGLGLAASRPPSPGEIVAALFSGRSVSRWGSFGYTPSMYVSILYFSVIFSFFFGVALTSANPGGPCNYPAYYGAGMCSPLNRCAISASFAHA